MQNVADFMHAQKKFFIENVYRTRNVKNAITRARAAGLVDAAPRDFFAGQGLFFGNSTIFAQPRAAAFFKLKSARTVPTSGFLDMPPFTCAFGRIFCAYGKKSGNQPYAQNCKTAGRLGVAF